MKLSLSKLRKLIQETLELAEVPSTHGVEVEIKFVGVGEHHINVNSFIKLTSALGLPAFIYMNGERISTLSVSKQQSKTIAEEGQATLYFELSSDSRSIDDLLDDIRSLGDVKIVSWNEV